MQPLFDFSSAPALAAAYRRGYYTVYMSVPALTPPAAWYAPKDRRIPLMRAR
jgi:hypothetical protein